MPEGTRVHRCVEEMGDKPGVNKYAVCQASTGQSFATGKPLKGKKDMPDEEVYEGEEDTPDMEVDPGAPDDQMEPPPEPGHGPGEAPPDMMEEPQEEAYGAQVHRRMHRDAMILMEEYHEMAGLLENPTVKKRLDKKLELLEKEMTEIEDEFASEYGHLDELEGAGTRPGAEQMAPEEGEEEAVPELDDEAIEADSEPPEDEEEPEEEAIGAMDSKGKKKKKALSSLVHNVKAIRHAMHGKCAICGKDMAQCKGHHKAHRPHIPGVQRDVHNVPGEEERQHKPGGRHRSPARHTDVGVEEFQKKPGRRHSDATLPGRPGYEEFQKKPGRRQQTAVRAKAGGGGGPVNDLTPVASTGQAVNQAHVGHPGQHASVLPGHHKRAVANAAQYLKGVSGLLNHADWGETHGRDAYYHARSLMDAVNEARGGTGQKAKLNVSAEASPEEIAQGAAMFASMEVPDTKQMMGVLPNPIPGVGGSSMPLPPGPATGGGDQQGPADDMAGQDKGLHPHYHTVEQAARFLGDLSQLKKDFSDSHRMAAEHWHKELDAIGREDEETNVRHPAGTPPMPPPDPMQQFDQTGAKALAWDIAKQREEAAAVAEQFKKLVAAIGVATE